MGRSISNFDFSREKNTNNSKANNVDIPISKKYLKKISRNPNR